MEEDLGDLDVGEVGPDVDVLGVHVVRDRFVGSRRASRARVEGARDEAGVLELSEVAGEQRGDELALAEDPE